jgi:hypothetical protein
LSQAGTLVATAGRTWREEEIALEPVAFGKFALCTLAGTVAMGFAGFVCGYFGPLVLSPDASAGPLVGIFITGPLGAFVGAVVGAAGALARLKGATFTILIAVATAIVAGASLYEVLPEDQWDGVIIDASIRGCSLPDTLVDGAIARWDKLNEDTKWRVPRPGWKEDVPRMLQRDRGVVLTMYVYRRRDVFKQRTPWNRGTLRATPWQESGRMESFFDRSTQGSCSSYALGRGAFYSTKWESSGVSPSDIPSSFLGLFVLRDVPVEFRSSSVGRNARANKRLRKVDPNEHDRQLERLFELRSKQYRVRCAVADLWIPSRGARPYAFYERRWRRSRQRGSLKFALHRSGP